jgi:hypothetical protein
LKFSSSEIDAQLPVIRGSAPIDDDFPIAGQWGFPNIYIYVEMLKDLLWHNEVL